MDEIEKQRWLSKDAWSEKETAWLLCGSNYEAADNAPRAADFNQASEALRRAVLTKRLRAIEPEDASDGDRLYGHHRFFDPAAVIAWAGDRFPNFPLQAEIQPPAEAPLPKQRMQEKEILRVLAEAGYDPKRLPDRAPGGAGPKAEARKALSGFSPSVFEKAWGRLRDFGEIAGAD